MIMRSWDSEQLLQDSARVLQQTETTYTARRVFEPTTKTTKLVKRYLRNELTLRQLGDALNIKKTDTQKTYRIIAVTVKRLVNTKQLLLTKS